MGLLTHALAVLPEPRLSARLPVLGKERESRRQVAVSQEDACQRGWNFFQSSCYTFNDPPPPYQKPWEEAREDCRRKISDLAVIDNDTEKGLIDGKIWVPSAAIRFWIGLRAEEGTWKWVDGSNLTQSSRIQQPPTNGLCVTSDKTNVWKAVNCSEKYTWLCKKKALSV
uniref:C-type lectin domain family 17, member A-like n=1 Tax=Monopterus albus TaxID=43700 RepID=UPI0009B4738C|nr:C-type lectin domain family 17, member A-like [Monopterus albus]